MSVIKTKIINGYKGKYAIMVRDNGSEITIENWGFRRITDVKDAIRQLKRGDFKITPNGIFFFRNEEENFGLL